MLKTARAALRIALTLAVTFLGLLLVTFLIGRVVPIDPVLAAVGDRAPPDVYERVRVELGLNLPLWQQFLLYLKDVLQGDFGCSTAFRTTVNQRLPEALKATGILMFWVMIVMVPVSLLIGVLAGMREGSRLDRSLSVASIASTATPEYVSGVVFTAIFASWLGWLNGSAATAITKGVSFNNFTLPVMTMAIYGIGYIARMTRASMAEVMTAQYIRTARLKGLSFGGVVVKHALRNALIAPFTVIMLQFPWLLTGVVVVESIFNYKGFGWLLVQAASNNDIDLVLACGLISVLLVLITQLISDIGYAFLNPRIRVA